MNKEESLFERLMDSFYVIDPRRLESFVAKRPRMARDLLDYGHYIINRTFAECTPILAHEQGRKSVLLIFGAQ